MKNYIEVHNGALVIDGHSDIPLDILYNRNRIPDIVFARNSGDNNTLRAKHIPVLNKGKVNIIFANLYSELIPEGSLKQVMLELGDLFQQMDETGTILICSKKNLEEVLSAGNMGFVLSLEGMEPLGKDLTLLKVFYRLGLRSAMLTWNRRNYFASGIDDTGGLSKLGREAVIEMEQMGIIVDISHLNEEGFWEVIRLAKKPVIASHSNARTLYDHPRNLTDAQIKAIVDTGGVIGLNGYFTAETNRASLQTYMDHLEYMLDLAGEDHVGLGLDFNGYFGAEFEVTPGLEDAGKIPDITQELVSRGYNEVVVHKLLGKNFLRILETVLE